MIEKKLVKSAGEHWVCGVLSQMGWAAALTRDGLERTDILAVNKAGHHLSIQVKTTTTAVKPKFMFGSKVIEPSVSLNEWYVLVALPVDVLSPTRAFVIPRDHASVGVWTRHMEWLTNENVKPGSRNSGINLNRIDHWLFERYEQRWDLLDEPTNKTPVMLPPRCRTLCTNPRVGLPEQHPWRDGLPEWDVNQVGKEWPDWWAVDL
jgi:hypothetical protein